KNPLEVKNSASKLSQATALPCESYCTRPLTPSHSSLAPVIDVRNGIAPTSITPSDILLAFLANARASASACSALSSTCCLLYAFTSSGVVGVIFTHSPLFATFDTCGLLD